MNEILKIFISLSVSGSMIAIILFALKCLYKNRLSKTWQYYIWLIVIIRLLVPYSLQRNMVGELFYKAEIYIEDKNQVSKSAILNDSKMSIPSSEETIDVEESSTIYWNQLKDNLWLLWIGIAIMLLVRKLTSYNGFVRYIKAGRYEVTNEHILKLYQSTYKGEEIKRPPMLYINPLVTSPMVVGIIQPFIVLPNTEMKDQELQNIFLHELTHYKRIDVFYKWLTQIAVCIHWFNPLIYFINREIDKNCELSCDENIIKKLDDKGKKIYGDTLLASLKFNGSYNNAIISITLSEDARLLKERLGAIMNFRKRSKVTVALSMILTIFVFCGAVFTGAYASRTNLNNSNNFNAINIREPQINQNTVKTDDISNTLNNVDKAGIELMEYSGSWEVVEFLIPNMSKDGVDKVTEIYNQKQYTSKVKKKSSDYYNMSGDNVDSRALAMMQANGMWKYTEPLFPYMSNDGIDKVVTLYNQKHQGQEKNPSDYYNVITDKEENIVINLKNSNSYNIAESGSFQGENGQILNLNIKSTIKGGTVDLFLFDPDGKEQCITIGYENFTKDIQLIEGLWQYNCSGIFKDGGSIDITGSIRD
ncbi:M56 family metallopeptidase [Tissierella praeacuta]|uniref:M56 family metallopeptidase n=1 Tax=Tissierella praeacuta TaxID=43131 RepID=UPI00333E5369